MEKITFLMLYGLMQLIRLTCRFEQLNQRHRDEAINAAAVRSFIMVCWHEHLVAASLGQLGEPRLSPIASRSGAGRIIGKVFSKLGFEMVYGSQNRDGRDKGGKQARDQLIRNAKQGISPALTVDGSIGPRRFCKPGAIDLSRQTGAQIVPVAAICSSFWTLNTWDRMQIPKPFSRIIVIFGEALPTVEMNLTKPDFLVLQNEVGNRINAAEIEGFKYLANKYGIHIRKPDLSSLN